MAIEDTWEGEIYKDIRTAVEKLPAILTAVEELPDILTAVENLPDILTEVEKIPETWSGTAYSKMVTTTDTTVLRWEAAETRLKRVQIVNNNFGSDPLFVVCVGLYNSNVTTFRSACYRLLPARSITFENINMYTLGYSALVAGYTTSVGAGGTRE